MPPLSRIPILVAIAAIGLPAGWLLASALTPRADRVAAALSLFRQNCLPMITQSLSPAAGTGLTRLHLEPDQRLYADPTSRLTVEFTRNGCAVSDQLDPLAAPDRDRLRQGVDALVARDLTILAHEPADDMGGDDISLWMQGARQSRHRWGVTLIRFAGRDADATTMLRLCLPARAAHHQTPDR